jgi:hypothetical protein
MKKIFSLLLICLTVIVTKAQKDIVVDPNAEVRTLNGSFNSIKVSGGIDLYLSQSDNEALAISASEEKFRNGIRTTVVNGTLRIYYEGEKLWTSRNRKLKVYVSFKNIDKLEASGASDVSVSGTIAVITLHLNLSGASDFKGDVKVNELQMDMSGASDVKISGSAISVNIKSSGASDVKGYDLIADVCTAKASGASDINITVNKELNAHASGASDIYFKDDGLIKEMHSSGASSVSRKS